MNLAAVPASTSSNTGEEESDVSPEADHNATTSVCESDDGSNRNGHQTSPCATQAIESLV